MLALKAKVPIVPVYITPGRKAFRGCTLTFGDPYYPEVEGKPTAVDFENVTGEIMRRVHALSDVKALGE